MRSNLIKFARIIKKNRNTLFTIIFFILVGYIFITQAKSNFRQSGIKNWKSSLWADQGGYYLYLPALFKYDMEADRLPPDTYINTGKTFSIDSANNKILDKYACGVAVMQLPVYLLMDSYAKAAGNNTDGFSEDYHLIPPISAILFLIAGIFVLWLFLKNFFKSLFSLLIITILVFGTNVYYYAIYASGMSHIYSFFLFSLLLFLVGKLFIQKSKKEYLYIGLIAFVLGMIVLVRPINILAVLLLFAGVSGWKDVTERFRFFIDWRKLTLMMVIGFVVLLPQLLYWYSISGNFFYYSYGDESFSNLLSPKLISFWFAPLNGLFTYNPLYFLLVFIVAFFTIKKNYNAGITMLLFLLISYISASWHMYYFGCGFGARNIVEYSVIFAIPLGKFLQLLRSKTAFVIFPLFIIFSIFINLRLSQKLERCFFGQDWDWHEYTHILFHNSFEMENQYEIYGDIHKNPISGERVKRVNNTDEYIEGISFFQKDECLVNVRMARISCYINTEYAILKGPMLVITMTQGKKIVYYQAFDISNKVKKTYGWEKVEYQAFFPKYSLLDNEIRIYFWNKAEDSFLIDNLQASFK